MKSRLILIALLLTCFIASCTDESAAADALYKSGFTDVNASGYSFGACGEGDFTATKFRAKNPHGVTVTGTVCCGAFLKGCTIRF